MKSTDEWREGFPDERGLYKCRVDGQEKYLVHHFCVNNCKHWWSDTAGRDALGHKIEFTGAKLSIKDI